ncbi:hypothetical protein L2E82_07669 [Cichorium intybus]|uniref:Uncharacterized protein n=1 Tax=Cichorium intybus TaxID=13427 RepID=A0ACB9G5B0_CICIN|nr:hypothetical protein L2E82_07669 [Cichorium intybus]
MYFPITLLDNPNNRLPPLCRWSAFSHLHLALLTYIASALLAAVGVHRFRRPGRRHTPLKLLHHRLGLIFSYDRYFEVSWITKDCRPILTSIKILKNLSSKLKV